MPYHLCYMLSYVNHHYLTLAARCPVSGCWPSCTFYHSFFVNFLSFSFNAALTTKDDKKYAELLQQT